MILEFVTIKCTIKGFIFEIKNYRRMKIIVIELLMKYVDSNKLTNKNFNSVFILYLSKYKPILRVFVWSFGCKKSSIDVLNSGSCFLILEKL